MEICQALSNVVKKGSSMFLILRGLAWPKCNAFCLWSCFFHFGGKTLLFGWMSGVIFWKGDADVWSFFLPPEVLKAADVHVIMFDGTKPGKFRCKFLHNLVVFYFHQAFFVINIQNWSHAFLFLWLYSAMASLWDTWKYCFMTNTVGSWLFIFPEVLLRSCIRMCFASCLAAFCLP